MGYRLKEAREEARMTQEELAAKSGVSRPTIIAIENDPDYNTTTGTLLKLANALGIPIEQIFFANSV